MKPTRIGKYDHTVRVCDVDGCHRRHVAQGYCWTHYHQVVMSDRAAVVQDSLFDGGCTTPGCWNPEYDDGMCAGHYSQTFTQQREDKALAAIFARIDRPDAHACWTWQGALNRAGYGVVMFRSQFLLVHRLVFEYVTEEPLGDRIVDHMCRVPACCNPEHLEAVDAAENARRFQVVNRTCERCFPGPIPAGSTLSDRLAMWGVTADFTPEMSEAS